MTKGLWCPAGRGRLRLGSSLTLELGAELGGREKHLDWSLCEHRALLPPALLGPAAPSCVQLGVGTPHNIQD